MLHKFSSKKIILLGSASRVALAAFLAAMFTFGTAVAQSAQDQFAIALVSTPVFYSSDLPGIFGGESGLQLKLDNYEQIDEVEFVALKGSVFDILETRKVDGRTLYRVETTEYSAGEKELWIDAGFVRTTRNPPAEWPRQLPDPAEIARRMVGQVGASYVWGGNVPAVPQLLHWYPVPPSSAPELKNKWALRGFDCSGLLYFATDGFTPRNTSELISYGEPVEIAGLTAEEIAKNLKPLDIIAWAGHTIIILDSGHTIESRVDYDKEMPGFQGGVRVRDLAEVLTETMAARTAVDDYSTELPDGAKKFVIRRWLPAAG